MWSDFPLIKDFPPECVKLSDVISSVDLGFESLEIKFSNGPLVVKKKIRTVERRQIVKELYHNCCICKELFCWGKIAFKERRDVIWKYPTYCTSVSSHYEKRNVFTKKRDHL